MNSPADPDLDLAIALSLAEADLAGAGSQAASKQAADPTAGDAELARRLQEELNLADPRLAPSPGAFASRPLPSAPSAAPPIDNTRCAGCGGSLIPPRSLFSGFGLAPTSVQYLTAFGRQWHPQCFKCAGCKRPIGDSGRHEGFVVGDSGEPYHQACHRDRFHPRCDVCKGWLPENQGRVSWHAAPFWGTKTCPVHATDGTKRCTSCTRMQPQGTISMTKHTAVSSLHGFTLESPLCFFRNLHFCHQGFHFSVALVQGRSGPSSKMAALCAFPVWARWCLTPQHANLFTTPFCSSMRPWGCPSQRALPSC